MRKVIFTLFVVFACIMQANSQSFVGTDPTNRNVVIEEFTGRNCGYCPDGHRIVNEIMASHPGRVWGINIHAGGFAPTSSPNMICPDGVTIHNGFGVSGYPSGVVNRDTQSAIDRGSFSSNTNTMLGQQSYVNVGGQAIINPFSRTVTVSVEVYYTGDSPQATNYLSVLMLQDSILGSQSDYGNYNPTQWADDAHTIYIHTHVLRDVINAESAWGEPITTTTTGTLVTREYIYSIPDIIGNPNGVEVDVNNIKFLALLNENEHLHVESCCELQTIISYADVFPLAMGMTQNFTISCSPEGTFDFNFMNGGTENLTSIEVAVEYNGQTQTFPWEGDIATGAIATMTIPVTMIAGSNPATLTITHANGEALEPSSMLTKSLPMICSEWTESVNTDTIIINIWQDKYGNEITWTLMSSDSTVLSTGGPYFNLGGNGTKLRTKAVAVPTDPECLQFVINDSNCDGINNGHGEGHYNITDKAGNIIFESDGTYTCSEITNMAVNHLPPEPPQDLKGDANGDGSVNILDIQVLLSYMNGLSPTPFVMQNADVNEDGKINILDIQRTVLIIIGL